MKTIVACISLLFLPEVFASNLDNQAREKSVIDGFKSLYIFYHTDTEESWSVKDVESENYINKFNDRLLQHKLRKEKYRSMSIARRIAIMHKNFFTSFKPKADDDLDFICELIAYDYESLRTVDLAGFNYPLQQEEFRKISKAVEKNRYLRFLFLGNVGFFMQMSDINNLFINNDSLRRVTYISPDRISVDHSVIN